MLSVKKLFESETKFNPHVKTIHGQKKNVLSFSLENYLNQHFRANHKENKTPIKVEDNKHNKAAKIFLVFTQACFHHQLDQVPC